MIKDKVAIITGASSGIGYATALALSKAGAKVAIGARRVDRLEELAKKILTDGGEVFYQKLDVTQRSECENFVVQAKQTNSRLQNQLPQLLVSIV